MQKKVTEMLQSHHVLLGPSSGFMAAFGQVGGDLLRWMKCVSFCLASPIDTTRGLTILCDLVDNNCTE